jgi:hypothetical protein
MTRDADQPSALPAQDETFLRRWSRRKLAAARDAGTEPAAPAIEPPLAPPGSPIADRAPSAGDTPPSKHTSSGNDTPSAVPSPLPPVESLTFESDFRAFLQPHVSEDLKRQALKKLLHDPRFNVMDGLDVYIDDYSVPSPLEPAVARALAHARYIFEPPPTRVNGQGHVEDVPPGEGDLPGEGVAPDEGDESQAIEVRAGEGEGVEEPAMENETGETLDTQPHTTRDGGDAPR